MKYGYLFYNKPVLPQKASVRNGRPMNLGDPIQSLAVIMLYREMGISDDDIIPVDRYDLDKYAGSEDVVLLVNGAENYEHYSYGASLSIPSEYIHPIYAGIHIHREITSQERIYFSTHGPVGSRDYATTDFLVKNEIDAFTLGCLTLTLPQRRWWRGGTNSVFLIDCPASLMRFIPTDLFENAITLSQIYRCPTVSDTDRITREEALIYHKHAYDQLGRIRDNARLVITSRLHAAAPCIAMGIPVILARDTFCERFAFLDGIIPLYTCKNYRDIDWNPTPPDIEAHKTLIKEFVFSRIKAIAYRTRISRAYKEAASGLYDFCHEMRHAAAKILSLTNDKPLNYAIWGVVMPDALHLVEAMKMLCPNSCFKKAVDTYASGNYMGVEIIRPELIEFLDQNIALLVPATAAHNAARELLNGTSRPYVLIDGQNVEFFNFGLSGAS